MLNLWARKRSNKDNPQIPQKFHQSRVGNSRFQIQLHRMYHSMDRLFEAPKMYQKKITKIHSNRNRLNIYGFTLNRSSLMGGFANGMPRNV